MGSERLWMGCRAAWLSLGLGLLSAERLPAAPDVVISELMAVNDSTVADEDGDYSDWIELYNAEGAAVNLDGWFLSDDAANLPKWRFPAVTLPAGGFLVVFASDKDRRDPARRLHASFKLASAGEDIYLVAPDGTTIVWSYLSYPPQVGGFSYGLAQNASRQRFVDSGAPATALVPADGSLGLTWTGAGFVDSGWRTGTTGLGYDRNPEYLDLIGLDVRSEMDGVNTSAYLRVRFNIADPSIFSGLLLRMKYDDGFIAYLNGVKLAGRNDPASPAWSSRATGLHDDSVAVIFEEYNLPLAPGSLVGGTNVLAIHGLNENAGSSDFLILPELEGLDSGLLDRDTRLYFHQPSPGTGNLPGYAGIAATPQISPASGVFSGSLAVSLTTAAETAAIHYTTDGSEPTRSSPVYSGPLLLQSSALLRARAFEGADSVSPLVSEGYIALAADVGTFTSDVPVVILENFGAGAVPASGFQPVFMAVFEPDGSGRARLTNAPTLQTRAGLQVRGSSTAGQPKQNYALEAWDETNQDTDIAPLGLPAESDWVLHAPYNFDLALMRNPLIFELSNQVGRYATRSRFVEVYINRDGGSLASADYAGVYSFMEKIKRGQDRVDVEELPASYSTEPLITGGYMLKIDRRDPGDSGFGAAGQSLSHVYPKEENIPAAQATWIRDYFDEFGAALNGPSFTDPVAGYAPYVDADSWVDHHILNVLAKNVDALRLSTHFFKQRGGKIEFGPIWDFDRSMDSTDGRDDSATTWNGTGDGTDYFNYPWWGRLFQDPDFWQKWKDRWQELRRGPLGTANMRAVIDDMAAEVTEAQARNFQRWSLLGGRTWQGEVNHLKSWLQARGSWIDGQFVAAPALSSAGGVITPGFQLTISAPAGTIHYTIDGSDPRARGGAVAAGASQYTGAITLNANSRVVARARTTAAEWSGPTATTFMVSTPRLVITELMYHPPDPPLASPHDADDFEYVEIQNVGPDPLRLAGARMGGGISFTFPSTATSPLDPGEYVLVVKNRAAFDSRYALGGLRIAGEYSGNLGNGGDEVILEGPLLEPILAFAYSDLWYPTSDGLGDSIFVLDPLADASSWSVRESWAAGSVPGGTPGRDDPRNPDLAGLQIPGDSNRDGAVDIADSISLLWRLFLGGSEPLPCDAATPDEGGNLRVLDVNADQGVNVSDVVYLLGYLFQSGPAPALGTSCLRIEGCPDACGA